MSFLPKSRKPFAPPKKRKPFRREGKVSHTVRLAGPEITKLREELYLRSGGFCETQARRLYRIHALAVWTSLSHYQPRCWGIGHAGKFFMVVRLLSLEEPQLRRASDKTMSAKTHLADSAEPLIEGKTLKARCGKEVPEAVFTLRWIAGELRTADFSTLLFCRHCVQNQSQALKHYVYGIRSKKDMPKQQIQEVS